MRPKAEESLPAWAISIEDARDMKGFVHVQARTEDQMSSFAAVVPKSVEFLRTKAATGKGDVFSFAFSVPGTQFHVTMNVVGRIRYIGKW